MIVSTTEEKRMPCHSSNEGCRVCQQLHYIVVFYYCGNSQLLGGVLDLTFLTLLAAFCYLTIIAF